MAKSKAKKPSPAKLSKAVSKAPVKSKPSAKSTTKAKPVAPKPAAKPAAKAKASKPSPAPAKTVAAKTPAVTAKPVVAKTASPAPKGKSAPVLAKSVASKTGSAVKASGREKAAEVVRPPVKSQFDNQLVGSMPAARVPGQKSSAQTAPPRLVKGRPVDDTPPQAPRPVPVPVTSGSKAKKNQAGMNVRDLEHYRDLLLAKRRELVGDMSSMETEALRSTSGSNLSNLPVHMADMGTDNYEQEFTLGLMEKDRQLLREINSALAKIQDGTYGICEGTGLPISKPRLEAQPWAKYSIEYARQMEKRRF